MFKVWGQAAGMIGLPVAVALMASVAPVHAGLDTVIAFDLPAGDLARTLVAISRQGGVMISFPPDVVAGRRSAAFQGSFTVREALARILAGTGLRMVPGAGGVTVVADTGPGPSAAAGLGDIAAIDVTDESSLSRFGDVGFQAGDAGDTVRLAGAPAKEIPLAVSAVTSEVIRSQVLTTATDAVQNVAGVNIAASNPNLPTFTIRGFRAEGAVVDGQRVVGFGNGGFGQVPVDDVERVEVLKGPTSILSGASGNGGAVNLSTKQPASTVIKTATVRYGTFNYKTLAFDFGGPIDGMEGLTYRFNIAGTMADQNYSGYRDQHEYLISPVVKWDNGETSILAGVRFFDQRRGPIQYTFIPRSIADVNAERPILRIPRGTAQANPNLRFRDQTIAVYSNQSHKFGDIFGFDVTVNNKSRYERSYDDVNGLNWLASRLTDTPAGAWRARQLYSPYDFTKVINQLDLNLIYDAGFAKQTSKFGIDYSNITTNLASNSGPIFSINPFTGFPSQPLFASTDNSDTSYTQNLGRGLGYYYLEKFDTLDNRLHIFGQVRNDDLNFVTRNRLGGRATTTRFQTSGISWTAGAAFDVTPYFTAYGNRAVGFIPQYSIVGATGQVAPPEERDQFEFGGRFFLFDKKLTATVSYFDLRATNVAVCDAILGCGSVQLIPGQISKGFEFEMQGEVYPGLNIIGSLSSVKARNVTGTITKSNAVPQYTASVWGAYTFQGGLFQGLTLGVGARGNSDSYTSLDVSLPPQYKIPGYITADAMIGYDTDRWSFQFKINNVFDKYAYLPSFSANFIGIARGRTFLVQARHVFD